MRKSVFHVLIEAYGERFSLRLTNVTRKSNYNKADFDTFDSILTHLGYDLEYNAILELYFNYFNVCD